MIDKQALLDQIKADIIAKNICPDLAKTAKNIVMGDGSPDADIIFIGEAPGRNEDEQGLPFVGASGKFLNEMLGMIGIDRSKVFITSILKYRPPKNRDPKPAEKEAFLPFLFRQIEVIEPKLIVTLGRHSMELFLPGLKIAQVHGEVQRSGALIVLPMYHPSYALYNGSKRQILIDDFLKIPQILNES